MSDGQRSIGGVWVNRSEKGSWFSISLEIDGEKLRFVAFKNTFKREGDKSPDYRIFEPQQQERIPTKPDNIEDSDVPF